MRGGQVRCGKCSTVFDGVAALVEESPEPLSLEPSPQLGLFDPSRRPLAGAASAGTAGAAQSWSEDEALPEFLAEPEPPARSALLWGFFALLAAAILFGQAAYRYRTEIAVLLPDTRQALELACRALHCRIALPRRPEMMSIESSDLQGDPRRENIIVLNAVLRNRAPFPQEFPALELTLNDDADRPVVRRVLGPLDYLGATRANLAQGLAAGAEASVRVNLDAGPARATGYRLYLFYPQ
jgi:hypothetical protein